jgi:hypothetical protein
VLPSPPIESPELAPVRKLDVRLRLSPWPARVLCVCIGLMILGAGGVLAWMMKGSRAWEDSCLIFLLLMAIMTALVIWDFFANRRGKESEYAFLLCVLFGWAFVGVWFGVGFFQVVGTIHLDNASTQAVEIELDGDSWHDLAPSRNLAATVRPGQHTITVRSADGDMLEEHEIKIAKRGVYVLNVLKAQTYYMGSVTYRQFPTPSGKEDPPELIQDSWIDVTTIDFLFQTPPDTITVHRNARMPEALQSQRRTYFSRWEVAPQDH